jgi:hypothetical protein
MRPTPAEEWQRLTRLYSEMTDGQLEDLANSFSDLTEFAQPILRDEMRKRGMHDPQVVLQPPPEEKDKPTYARLAPRFAGSSSSSDESEEDDDAPDHEYTWKTELCTCENKEEAWQIGEVLRIAGIESWAQRPGVSFGTRSIASLETQILVAADQLDDARAVIAKPIPQEIIDQSKAPVEDFVVPACPKCGAPDPILESIEPANTWHCEVCNAEWSDPVAEDSATGKSGT